MINFKKHVETIMLDNGQTHQLSYEWSCGCPDFEEMKRKHMRDRRAWLRRWTINEDGLEFE